MTAKKKTKKKPAKKSTTRNSRGGIDKVSSREKSGSVSAGSTGKVGTSAFKAGTPTSSSSSSSGDVSALAQQLADVSAQAKSRGIDTQTADKMVAQTKAQGSTAFKGSSFDTPNLNTSGFADLKSMSVGLANGEQGTPQQTPEEYAKSVMEAMSQNNPDTSGVGTQSTQGEQVAVNDSMAPTATDAQAPGAGQGISTAGVPGAPQPTTASGGYTKIGPAYFQKSPDGLRAVSDKTVIAGLKNGSIPYDAGQLDGTTFSKYAVPLVDSGKAQVKGAVDASLGIQNPMQTVDQGADIGTTYQAYQEKYGLTQDQTDFYSDPQKTITDMTKAIYKMSGIDEANSVIKDITNDLEDLENKRDDEINDVNDNPWLTEGVRQRQIASIENRYEDKIANHTNKLKLLEDVRNSAQQSAQFAVGTAISLWDKERTFQQQQIDRWNDQAQRAIDNDFKMKAYNMELSQLGKTSEINNYLEAKRTGFDGGFYEYTHPEKAGGTSDWTMFNTADGKTVMYNQRTGAQVPMAGGSSQQTKDLAVVNDISNLLTDPGFDQAFGLSNIARRNTPGTSAYLVAQNVDNLISQLALGARGQLKGQGAVSDFEGKLLKRAQTSLTLNMNPAQARFELAQVRGAIQTSSGLTATVRITGPDGRSKVGEADQATITEAVANGYRVQYE